MTYDAFALLFAGLATQSEVSSESIIKGLQKVETFHGVTGPASYRGTGDPERRAVISRLENGLAMLHEVIEP